MDVEPAEDVLDEVIDAILAGDRGLLDELLRRHAALPQMRQLGRAVDELRKLLPIAPAPAAQARHRQLIHNVLEEPGPPEPPTPPP